MSATQEVGNIFGAGSGPANAMLRSPTVLIAAVGLWGMNIFFFRVFGIDYISVLKYDFILIDSADDDTTTPSTLGRLSPFVGTKNSTDGAISNTGINTNTTSSIEMRKPSKDVHAISAPSTTSSNNNNNNIDQSSFDYEDNDINDDDDSVESTDTSDPNSAVTWDRLVALSVSLLLILHLTRHFWIFVMKGGSLGAVFAFYGAVTTTIILPVPSTRWLRKSAVIVLQRSFELINPRCSCVSPDKINGPRPIPFLDVFFADAMCSLSKVFFDWGMLWEHSIYFPNPVPQSTRSILVPSACAAVPFFIRARQCQIMYTVGRIKNDPKRYSHLWNALKYSTSIFPLCLSAYQKTLSPADAKQLDICLIILLAINALYALYWDIVMDWGMMKNPAAASAVVCAGGILPSRTCAHALLRSRLRFGVGMSALIVVADAVLRFSWTLRFYSRIFPSDDSFVLCTQFLEIFRRAIWNLLRVEWENIKQLQETKAPPIALRSLKSEEEMTAFLTIPREPKRATA